MPKCEITRSLRYPELAIMTQLYIHIVKILEKRSLAKKMLKN